MFSFPSFTPGKLQCESESTRIFINIDTFRHSLSDEMLSCKGQAHRGNATEEVPFPTAKTETGEAVEKIHNHPDLDGSSHAEEPISLVPPARQKQAFGLHQAFEHSNDEHHEQSKADQAGLLKNLKIQVVCDLSSTTNDIEICFTRGPEAIAEQRVVGDRTNSPDESVNPAFGGIRTGDITVYEGKVPGLHIATNTAKRKNGNRNADNEGDKEVFGAVFRKKYDCKKHEDKREKAAPRPGQKKAVKKRGGRQKGQNLSKPATLPK